MKIPLPVSLASFSALGLLAAGPTPASAAPVSAVATEKKVSVVERISVTGLTMQQALAKPDATELVHPDGRKTTVGELRKRVKARELLRTTKPKALLTGGSLKTAYLRGATQSKGVVEVAQRESAAALALRTPKNEHAKATHPIVGIENVNGKGRGFVLSPGGNVTIVGGQLGDTIGQVNVIGQFAGGAAPLRVVDWRADEIQALFPPGLRGVLDHDVTLQVITSAGKTFRFDGGKFVAAREDIVVTTNILRMVRFQSAPNWPAQLRDDGWVSRGEYGDSVSCRAPSTDRITVVDPGRGFFITNLQLSWGRTDTGDGSSQGDAGGRYFQPGYGVGGWEGDSIDIHWGVWKDHESPDLFLSGSDNCQSDYGLALVLTGPAGVSPF
jgi:hypothetical protein